MKDTLLIASLLLVSALALTAQAISAEEINAEEIKLWGDRPIPFNKSTISLEEKMDSTGRRISQISEPRLHIYRRKGMDKAGPTLLYLPGGGYARVVLKDQGAGQARYFLDMGFDVVAFLVYRLPDPHIVEEQHKVPLCDAQKALSLLRATAMEWQIDPDRIAVMGSSAGGHLAASLANLRDQPVAPDLSSRELEHALSILLYPVISFNEPHRHQGSCHYLLGERQEEQKLLDRYSMEQQVSGNTPPTLLIHARDDASVPFENSLIYQEALIEAGVSCSYIELQKGGHGFGFNRARVDRDWLPEMEAWIRRHMELRPPEEE